MQNSNAILLSLLAIFVFVLILIIAMVVFFMGVKHRESERERVFLKALNDEKERTMYLISMEVHDNLTQMLCMARMFLHKIHDYAIPATKGYIEAVSEIISELIAVSHNMAHSLHPDFLKEKGLRASLEREVEWLRSLKKIEIEMNIKGDEYSLGSLREIMVFRILQESLNNVYKHAEARIVMVEINYGRNIFSLKIADDGKGFDTSGQSPKLKGLGLLNLYRRAELCRGQLNIYAEPGKGTEVLLLIPFNNLQSVA